MPSEMQIIDGFEALRAEFMTANPSVLIARGSDPGNEAKEGITPSELLQAWLRATLGITDLGGRHLRWVKSVVREALAPRANGDSSIGPDMKNDEVLRKHPGFTEDFEAVIKLLPTLIGPDGRVRLSGSPANLAGEAAAWERTLPRLGRLRAWKFLAYIGRPVIVPDLRIRRFLWRLGMIENNRAESPGDAAVAACIEKIVQLTRMPASELDTLLQWHTRRLQGLTEGNRCGRNPDCNGCPLSSGCLWFRFRGNSAGQTGEGPPERVESSDIHGKFDSLGVENLEEAELLVLLLQSGAKGMKPLDLAREMLRRFEGLKGIAMASLGELCQFEGVGETRARQLKAALELGARLAAHPLRDGDPIGRSADVWLAYRNRYKHISQEHFITLLLDSKNRLIRSCIISKGTLNGSPTHPREVFKEAIRHSSSAVILMHNHPSGDPAPSPEDLAVTRQLIEAGKILGIRVLDHIILGAETYYSFKDEGRI